MVVYRLITCGTVEEKIYRKQVYKGGISRAGMDDGNHYRYFSHEVQRPPPLVRPLRMKGSNSSIF